MTNGYGHLKTGTGEYIKQHIVYDGSDRLTTVYEARANAVHDAPCLRTDYAYVGASALLSGMKESESYWDASWDF